MNFIRLETRNKTAASVNLDTVKRFEGTDRQTVIYFNDNTTLSLEFPVSVLETLVGVGAKAPKKGASKK